MNTNFAIQFKPPINENETGNPSQGAESTADRAEPFKRMQQIQLNQHVDIFIR